MKNCINNYNNRFKKRINLSYNNNLKFKIQKIKNKTFKKGYKMQSILIIKNNKIVNFYHFKD